MSSPLIGSTGGPALSPRCRKVIFSCAAASITPTRRMSSAVSSSALVSRLGCFVVAIGYLLQYVLGEGSVDLARRGCEPPGPDFPKRQQLVGIDVVALVLGKPVEEHRALPGAIRDQQPMPTGAALPGTGDALLDQPAPQVGIDQSAAGRLDRLDKAAILDPLPAREADEPFGFEDAHVAP